MSTSWIGDRKPDRYVPGFGGRMNAIYSPVGTPKPREECQPFTFEFANTDRPDVKGQEKFMKGLEKVRRAEAREVKARDRKAKAHA